MFGYIWVISVIYDIYYRNMKLGGNIEIDSLWGRMVELDSLITHLWEIIDNLSVGAFIIYLEMTALGYR